MKERPILFSSEMVQAILDGHKNQTRRIMNPQPLTVETSTDCLIVESSGERPSQWFTFDNKTNIKILTQHLLQTAQYPDAFYTAHRRAKEHPYYFRKWERNEVEKYLCPYGKVGDRLWVRETFADGFIDGIGSTIIYKADNPDFDKDFLKNGKWEPSIFMPREASRITRENTEIRIERVADISEQDAIGEGIYDVGKDIGYKKSLWFDYLEKGGDQGGSYLGFKDPIKSYKSLWDSINNIPKLNKKLDSYFVYPFDEQSATKWGNTYRNKSLIVIPNPWAWVIKFKKLSLEEV